MLFVAWLASVFVPGVGELVEDAVHVALDEHGRGHASGEIPCPEHGCTPTSHHCSCCVSLSVDAVAPQALVPSAHVSDSHASWPPSATPRSGFTRRLLRPPAA